MSELRVVQLSDCHLSPVYPHAVANFEMVVAWLNERPPALVVNTGNCMGSERLTEEELQLSRSMHRRIAAPVVAVPGSGDIGENGALVVAQHRVTEQRVQRFAELWSADRFSVDVGHWRLLGINSQVCAELPDREHEQLEWFGQHLGGAANVATFMHKPMSGDRPPPADAAATAMERTAHRRLWSMFRSGPVHLVASGHLHRSRSSALANGLTAVWAPSTAAMSAEWFDGSNRRCGVMEYIFDGPTVRWRHAEVPGMVHGDRQGLDRHRTTPRCVEHLHRSPTPAS